MSCNSSDGLEDSESSSCLHQDSRTASLITLWSKTNLSEEGPKGTEKVMMDEDSEMSSGHYQGRTARLITLSNEEYMPIIPDMQDAVPEQLPCQLPCQHPCENHVRSYSRTHAKSHGRTHSLLYTVTKLEVFFCKSRDKALQAVSN
ncbi:uncharacterized protein [Periplaneta americana]|uniref:uncharacterized protein isoform X3 n=1 Tax=Periplaneta americana TaxID=6978 RepID=UPI0037E8D65B